MSRQKGVGTIESFFTPNQSQIESEKNDTEEQCFSEEETDEDQRKPKNSSTNFPENLVGRSHMVAL